MSVAKETEEFADALKLCEGHGRQAIDIYARLCYQDSPEELKRAENKLRKSLKHAVNLPGILYKWTANVAAPVRNDTHLTMTPHLGAFAKGVAGLKRAREASSPETVLHHVSEALGPICQAHRELVDYCCKKGCPPIEIPEIPPQEDGGGR